MAVKTQTLKGVVLDLDGTLYFYEPCNKCGKDALFSFLGKELKRKRADIEKTFIKSRKEVHRTLKGVAASHSRLLYIQKCIESLEGKTDIALSLKAEGIFWAAYFRAMKLSPGALAFLKTAKKRGLKIAIVSDFTTRIQMKKLIHLRIDQYVDFLITSEESGKEKPAPDFFHLALKKLKLSPREVVSIGDSYERDIIAPRRLGMRAFRAHNFQKIRKSILEE